MLGEVNKQSQKYVLMVSGADPGWRGGGGGGGGGEGGRGRGGN